MAQISFDGRFFALVLDDGGRVLLLDAKDNISNASCRSLLQEQFDGFGQSTGQEQPLMPWIGVHMQKAAAERGPAIVGDAAAAILFLKHFFTAPHAVKLLYVGASIGSPCLRLVSSILAEAVPHPLSSAARASLSITAVAPLADAADVPAGILPIRTDLARLLLPRGAFDLLLFDARGLDEAIVPHAAARAAAALRSQGFAVLLGASTRDASLFDHIQGFPLAPNMSLFFGTGRENQDGFDGGAKIRRERKALGQRLQAYLSGDVKLVDVMTDVFHYSDLLTEQPADVPWRAERAHVAQVLELLVDRRLGQAAASSEETLRKLTKLF